MRFVEYCDTLKVLEENSSRTFLTEKIAELLNGLAKGGHKDSLKQGMYMLRGSVVPEYISFDFGFSNKSFINAINVLALDMGLSYDAKVRFSELGDSGLLAEDFLMELSSGDVGQGQQVGLMAAAREYSPKDNSLSDVFAILEKVGGVEGEGAVARRANLIIDALLGMTSVEGKYFARIVTGNMRLGVSNKTLLDAISWAKVGDKSLRKSLDRAFGLKADAGELAVTVLVEGGDLEEVHLALGIPLASQLVEREKDTEAIIKRMGEAIVQPKYDGLRAQLHFSSERGSGQVDIFSRNMTPLTDMFPDLVELFEGQDFTSIVLDGEVIGYDETTDSFLPFQDTIQRKRKYGVKEAAESIPIKYFIFDILYLNGKDLTQRPLQERLDTLREVNFNDPAGKLQLAESPIYTNAVKLEAHFRKQLDFGLEGVIAKDPESIYSPGKRGYDWIKLKANTFADLKDTVDAVVLGYYNGRGHRAKHGIGGFLVGLHNSGQDVYQTIAKVGGGVKDDEWGQIKERLDEISVGEMPDNYQIIKPLRPDVFVRPEIVMEVDADEITLSKNHTAGVGDDVDGVKAELGFSLRFPRVKIFGRDKSVEQSTTIEEVRRLYGLGKKS